jgi:signal peptidase I
MLQLVHDTQFQSEMLRDVGWPAHWQSETRSSLPPTVSSPSPTSAANGWSTNDAGKTFHCAATEQPSWLRFRQFYINFDTWEAIVRRRLTPKMLSDTPPQPVPVTDFYAYNAYSRHEHPQPIGNHWVGDLALEADLNVRSESGELWLDLVEAGRHHRCRVDLATGIATLSIDEGRVPFGQGPDEKRPEVTAQTPMQGAGHYTLRFANVDDQLYLWVNDKVCSFSHPPTYGGTENDRPRTSPQDPSDLQPVGIGATNAELQLNSLRVLRDIYYSAVRYGRDLSPIGLVSDYGIASQKSIVDHLIDPKSWKSGDLFDWRGEVEFRMKKDQFFPLGDNSPYSKDGRLWEEDEHYVARDLLIGKALLVYWPRPYRMGLPGAQRSIPVFPNFPDMRTIH